MRFKDLLDDYNSELGTNNLLTERAFLSGVLYSFVNSSRISNEQCKWSQMYRFFERFLE